MEKIISGSREKLFTCPIFYVEGVKIEQPDGRTAHRNVVRHSGGCGAVAVDDNGRVCLIKQWRVALEETVIEIPAGKLETEDTDPLMCAQRELREEAGLLAQNWELLIRFYPTPGYSNEILYVYLATGLSECERDLDDGEFIESDFYELEQMAQRANNGEIPDSKTALGLILARERLKNKGV